MARAFDGTEVPRSIVAPCGNIAHIDPESTIYGYRCTSCFAVVGSAGMPRECFDAATEKDAEDGQ